MEENPNIIIYTNYFEFENSTFAFRKKELFCIDTIPKWIKINENLNCYLIKRKQLSISKIKELIQIKNIKVDVSSLQWFEQINLSEVINLK